MRFVELIEQIDILEASKDKYLPMLNFLDQIPTSLGGGTYTHNVEGQITNIKNSALKEVEWAAQNLHNSDRIVWFVRLVRISALQALVDLFDKQVKEHQSWGSIADQPTAAEIEAMQQGGDPEAIRASQENAMFRRLLGMYQKLHGMVAPLLQKDIQKMKTKGTAEVSKELEEADAKWRKAAEKLKAMKERCERQPDHRDCGLNLERLEVKVNELGSMSEVFEKGGEVFALHWGELMGIKNQLAHFESMPYQPLQEYRFGWKPSYVVLAVLELLENTWAKTQEKTLTHDVAPGRDYEGIEKIMDFGDGMAWWNLHRKYCEREGTAMGHCGNKYANAKESDEVISLREFVGKDEHGQEKWAPHVTGVFDTANGMLGEMKGRSNNKPEAKYHRYIIPLLKEPWLKGILMRAHQHEKYKNFYVSDLPEDIARELVEQKPDLATWKDRQVLGLEGDMSSMELDKINEQLDEWDVENIEAQRDEVFVMTTYSNKEQAYEAWSGQSWPEENWVDAPESEDYDTIYENLGEDKETAKLMKEFMYLSNIDEYNKQYDVPQGENLNLDAVDYAEMLNGYYEENNEHPLEDFVDEKWKEYHAAGMQGDAEHEVDNVYEYGLGEGYDYSVEDEGDEGLAITMPMDYFFSEVMPNLEKQSSGYGTTSWEQLLGLRVGDASERYWENFSYGGEKDEMLGNFVEWGLQHTSDEHPTETIDDKLRKGIEEAKQSVEYEIHQLKKDQLSLPLDEPDQEQHLMDPQGRHREPYKGAPPRERLPDPWYKDWIDKMEQERRR